jgi:hypothetical protein
MIASRCIFIFITLFLAMVLTISTAPVIDSEVVTTVNEIEETSDLPEVVTDRLLFFDVTRMPLDENVKTGDVLLFEKDSEMPIIPITETPQSFQISLFNSTVTEHYLSE